MDKSTKFFVDKVTKTVTVVKMGPNLKEIHLTLNLQDLKNLSVIHWNLIG